MDSRTVLFPAARVLSNSHALRVECGHVGLALVTGQGVIGAVLVIRFAGFWRVLDAQLVKIAAVFGDLAEHFVRRRLGRFLGRCLLFIRCGGRSHRLGIFAFGGYQQGMIGNLVDGSLVGDIRGVDFIVGEVIVVHQVLLIAACQSFPSIWARNTSMLTPGP